MTRHQEEDKGTKHFQWSFSLIEFLFLLFFYNKVFRTETGREEDCETGSNQHDRLKAFYYIYIEQTNHRLVTSDFQHIFYIHFYFTAPKEVLRCTVANLEFLFFFFYIKNGWWKTGRFFVRLLVCWLMANFVCGETGRLPKCLTDYLASVQRGEELQWLIELKELQTTGAGSGPTSERR